MGNRSTWLSTFGILKPVSSKSDVLIVAVVNPGNVAICQAIQPNEPDFSCGFQSHLSAGTRSSVFWVLDISRSNSRINNSLIGMRAPSDKVSRVAESSLQYVTCEMQ